MVAIAAAVVTAHGLAEVAGAAHVPAPLAWAYPVITDGLALVAYMATSRLTGAGARYAWTVVIVAAGVSGLAQAAYLASGALPEAPAWLRAGIGAWPAIAAAVAAHLLHLLADPAAAAGLPSAVAPSDGMTEQMTPALEQQSDDAPEEPPSVEPTPGGEVDPRVLDLAAELAAGEDITGAQAGERFSVGERTGRRLLGEARAHLEAAAPRADPAARSTTPLHLVERSTTA